MRVRARKDGNHAAIVKAFRSMKATVADLAQLGDGVPDILVGMNGKNFLIEIKDGDKPPSKRKLTEDEAKFHDEWKGQVAVVEGLQDVVDMVNKARG